MPSASPSATATMTTSSMSDPPADFFCLVATRPCLRRPARRRRPDRRRRRRPPRPARPRPRVRPRRRARRPGWQRRPRPRPATSASAAAGAASAGVGLGRRRPRPRRLGSSLGLAGRRGLGGLDVGDLVLGLRGVRGAAGVDDLLGGRALGVDRAGRGGRLGLEGGDRIVDQARRRRTARDRCSDARGRGRACRRARAGSRAWRGGRHRGRRRRSSRSSASAAGTCAPRRRRRTACGP